MSILIDAGEWLTGPVAADLAEEAILDGIPFGRAWRIVTER